MQHNEKGQIDELMYTEDSFCYLMDSKSKTKRNISREKRANWMQEHLYLPSYISMNERSDMLNKYGGSEALHVEKDVSPTFFHNV